MAASLGVKTVVGQLSAVNVSTAAEDIVGICHQATTVEGRADREDLLRAVVNCRGCELAIAV
jgi:hypothetical protein